MDDGNEAEHSIVNSGLTLQASPVVLPADSLDVSEGDVGDDVVSLVTEQIRDRKQFRTFRRVAFYGVWALICLCFLALLAWMLTVGERVASPATASTYQATLFVTPLIVLASVGALLVLALLRFAFQPMDRASRDDSPDALGVVHGLGREALGVVKDYLARRGAGHDGPSSRN